MAYGAWPASKLSKPGACYSAQALERFASAYAEAYRIRQVYGPKVEQTADPQEVDRLMQEADAAVNQAIRDHGLDVPSFFMLEEAIFGFRGVDFGPYRDKFALTPEEIGHIVKMVQDKITSGQ
jgi:hypothetical protein